jgi:hypothetical protein
MFVISRTRGFKESSAAFALIPGRRSSSSFMIKAVGSPNFPQRVDDDGPKTVILFPIPPHFRQVKPTFVEPPDGIYAYLAG